MLLAVTPDPFIPEEHPIRRIKPIVESAAADRACLGGALCYQKTSSWR